MGTLYAHIVWDREGERDASAFEAGRACNVKSLSSLSATAFFYELQFRQRIC
jgi:hypothetical protein